ncbi:MAG: glycosyltransferase family 2 protein [Myxococcota bacterium]|jgi:glycosyltransferase involved in cell wall biosynthesis|nr:glycosyltransferase family 2 protein [Myxococcota bacterium]
MSEVGTQPARLPLSICVLTCNDETVLARCLASLGFAAEVLVVVDAKSTDGSEKIARELAHRVEVHAYRGDIEQKSRAVDLATHDWVLIVDSDEVVTQRLEQSLCSFFETRASDTDLAAAEINRITFHLGRWLRHGDFYPDWTLRLFRKSRATWVGKNPHGRVEVMGRVERLEGDLEHYSYQDLADQVERIQRFSDAAAAALQAEGKRFAYSDLVLRPPARFLRAYLLKQGYRDGLPGFIVAVATAFHVFLKYAKLWERERRGRE